MSEAPTARIEERETGWLVVIAYPDGGVATVGRHRSKHKARQQLDHLTADGYYTTEETS